MTIARNVASLKFTGTNADGSSAPAIMLPFSIAKTDHGAVIDQTTVELEELTTPGVDGRRWRQVRTFYPSFTMETWADAATYSAAIAICRNYWLVQGQFATLTWTAGGYSGQYLQVKVIDVQARAMAGSLNGFGAETTSLAIIQAIWTLAVQAQAGVTPS